MKYRLPPLIGPGTTPVDEYYRNLRPMTSMDRDLIARIMPDTIRRDMVGHIVQIGQISPPVRMR
ncbi:MAG: hypothetical protein Q8R16_04915 [bacterium]|nr:hypothetical protein [bacterium]